MADSKPLSLKIEAVDATRQAFNTFQNNLQKARLSLKEMALHLKDVGKAGASSLHKENFVSLTAQVNETSSALTKLSSINERLSTATKVSQKDNIKYKQVLKKARDEVDNLEKAHVTLQQTLAKDTQLDANLYAESLTLVKKKLDSAKASLVEYGRGTLIANWGLTRSVELNKELGTATNKLIGENSKLIASQKQYAIGTKEWFTQAKAKSDMAMKNIVAEKAAKRAAHEDWLRQVKINSKALEDKDKRSQEAWGRAIVTRTEIRNKAFKEDVAAAKKLRKEEEKALRQKQKLIDAEKTFAKRVKTSAKNLGAYFIVYRIGGRVLDALGRAFVGALRKSIALEKALLRASTIAGPFKTQMWRVEKSVKRMSAAFGTDVVDNVDAFYKVLSAGFKDNPLKVLAAAQKASVGGFVEIGDSVRALTAVMNIFNKSVEEADEINNVLFKAVDQGVFVYGDMASGIATAGQSAKNAGIKFKELMGILAASSKTTQSMAKSATQVRQAAIAMMKPTAAMTMVLERLGVATGQELVDQMDSGIGAFQAIRQATDDLGLSLAKVMGRKEAFNAILSLTNKNLERTVGVIEKVSNKQDLLSEATKKATALLDTNLKKWGELGSQLTQSAINPWLDRFNKFIDITEEKAKSLSEKITVLGHAFTILAQPGSMTAKLGLVAVVFKNQDKILAQLKSKKVESIKAEEALAEKIRLKAADQLAKSLIKFDKTQAARKETMIEDEVSQHRHLKNIELQANRANAKRERALANKKHEKGILDAYKLNKKLGEITIEKERRQLDIELDFKKNRATAISEVDMRFIKERLEYTNKTTEEKEDELASKTKKRTRKLATDLAKITQEGASKIQELKLRNIKRKLSSSALDLSSYVKAAFYVEQKIAEERIRLQTKIKIAEIKGNEGLARALKKILAEMSALKQKFLAGEINSLSEFKLKILQFKADVKLAQAEFKQGVAETVDKAKLLREQLEEIISIYGGIASIVQNVNTLWGALGNKTSKWLTGLMHVAQIMQKIFEIQAAINKQKIGAALGAIGGLIGAGAGIATLFMHEGGPIKKLHKGGVPNILSSNEVPIIAERGEFMFSKRAVDNLGGQGNVARMHQNVVSGGQQAGTNVQMNVSFDPDNFRNFLTRTEEGKSIIHNAVIEAFPS